MGRRNHPYRRVAKGTTKFLFIAGPSLNSESCSGSKLVDQGDHYIILEFTSENEAAAAREHLKKQYTVDFAIERNPPNKLPPSVPTDFIPLIDTLILRKNFITETQENEITQLIDTKPWDTTLRRRTQHYGVRFNYKTLNPSQELKEGSEPTMPSVLKDLGDRLVKEGVLYITPNQVTINEYLPGSGIGYHVDTHSAFEGGIAIISLISTIIMNFKRDGLLLGMALPARSAFAFHDEARFLWEHGIPSRRTDIIDGKTVARQRRVSITYRHVKSNVTCSCPWPAKCDFQNPTSLELPTRIA